MVGIAGVVRGPLVGSLWLRRHFYVFLRLGDTRTAYSSPLTPITSPNPMTFSLRALTLALLVLPFSLVGCDAIEEAAGLNDVNVPLGSAGDNLPVAPNVTTYNSDMVSVNADIPGSPSVDGIDIKKEDVTYTAVMPRGLHRGAASCDLSVTMLIDDAPAVSADIMIVDDVVSDVSVGYASPDYDRARLCSAIGADVCPVGELTRSQIDSTVESALNSGSFEVGFVVDNPGDCSGTLDIDAVNFDLSL